MEEFIFVFLLAFLLIHYSLCSPEVPWCSVAEENKPFELNCTLDIMSHESNTFMIWESIEKFNESKDISTCALSQQTCDAKKQSKYAVKFFNEGGKKVFNLKFRNISFDVGDSGIRCLVWTLNGDDMKELFSCQMAVHRPNSGVQCTMEPFTGGVRLKCTITGVFPGIVCLFNETLNNVMKKSNILMHTTNIGYNTSGALVYNSTCQATVYHTQTGIHEYTFSYKPDYPKNIKFNGRLQLPVTNIPSLRAMQVNSILGSGNTNITVMCSASGFKSQAVFKLLLSNQEITANEQGTHFTTYKINVNSSFQGKLLKCEADFKDNPWKDFAIYDTKALNLKWPPPAPPSFLDYHSNASLGNVFEISKGADISVACVARGGNPVVSYIRVQCWRNKTLWLDNARNTDSFNFYLFGNVTFEIQGCLCIAQQPTTNYNATSFIIVYVKPSQGLKGPLLWDPSANNMKPVYYIIAVMLFLLLLPVILGTCIYISRYGDDLYSNFYSSPSTLESNEYISNVCIAETGL